MSFQEILRILTEIKRDDERGLPRSQIYKILRLVRAGGGYFGGEALKKAADEFIKYKTRAGNQRDLRAKDFLLPSLSENPLRLAFDLALIAELWDYAAPFDDPPLMPFVQEAAPQ